jgi:hypothetical protein
MPIDKSYLAKHGPSWRVQVAVPKALQPIIGASVLFASTKTDSLALANLRKHALIHTLKERIRAAKGDLRKQGRGQPDPLTSEALEWKAALAASTGEPYDPVQDALSYRLDEIEQTMGEPQAATLAAIATGQPTSRIGGLAQSKEGASNVNQVRAVQDGGHQRARAHTDQPRPRSHRSPKRSGSGHAGHG